MPTPLPARNILDGSSTPTTSMMKGALGALRDYLAEKIGADAGGPVVSSLNGGQLAGNRNKIINPFTENQRALTSVPDDAYCCDRWYVLTESGNVSYAIVTDPEPGAPSAIRLTQPDATPKRMGAATIIESKDIRQYRSTAMNFAARVKPSFTGNVRYAIIEHTGTADVVTSDVVNNWASTNFTPGNFFISGINLLKTGTVAPGAATYGDFSDWVVLGASTNNVILFFWTEAAQAQGATLEANRPQYEPGVVRTMQEWRLNELQLCQRYYEVLFRYTGSTAYQATKAPSAYSRWVVPWRVQKRAAPTVAIADYSNNAGKYSTWAANDARTDNRTPIAATGDVDSFSLTASNADTDVGFGVGSVAASVEL